MPRLTSATSKTTGAAHLISQTVTGGNQLKEYELVVKVSDIKLNKNGYNFTKWNESVANHPKTIELSVLFDYSPSINTIYPICSQFPV